MCKIVQIFLVRIFGRNKTINNNETNLNLDFGSFTQMFIFSIVLVH